LVVFRTVFEILKHEARKDHVFSRTLPLFIFGPTGNSAIQSADPENTTLEPNITSIGKPVAKLWPFLYIQDGRQPPSWIFSWTKSKQGWVGKTWYL